MGQAVPSMALVAIPCWSVPSQAHRLWLKLLAPLNMSSVSKTLDMSQVETSWLNAVAPWNVEVKLSPLLTFQAEIS